MLYLESKAIVVTGAGRGLGAAYARLAAAEGAAVVVNDVDSSFASAVVAEIHAAGGRAVADGNDISTWEGAGALISGCVEEFGAIDGLVNNAGIFRLADPVWQDPAEFRAVIEVNLLGTAYCGLHAIRAMVGQGLVGQGLVGEGTVGQGFVGQGRGSVVNVTSGAHAGSAAMGAYGASKGGVASLTYCWAADLAGSGVRVNAVSPNAHTRMADEFERHLGDRAQGQNLRKPPEQNAPAVVFLLSDAAADVNGQIVRIDGEELSLIGHPVVLGSGQRDPQWTVARVADAFALQLASSLQPVGLRRVPLPPRLS